MSITHLLILFAVGMVASFFNVAAGGGSLLTLPVLIFMGLPATVANATNRIGIISQNIFAVAGFRSKGVGVWPYSLYIAISAFFGAILGARISANLDDALFNKIIAIIMIGVGVMTVFGKKKDVQDSEKLSRNRQIVGVITFFFVGVYGGFIQAGVGFIMIAALTTINGLSLVKTNSAKVFVALMFNISALGVFLYEDLISWPHGLALALGNALGGWITSRWSVAKGDKWLKPILLIAVTVMAVKLWLDY